MPPVRRPRFQQVMYTILECYEEEGCQWKCSVCATLNRTSDCVWCGIYQGHCEEYMESEEDKQWKCLPCQALNRTFECEFCERPRVEEANQHVPMDLTTDSDDEEDTIPKDPEEQEDDDDEFDDEFEHFYAQAVERTWSNWSQFYHASNKRKKTTDEEFESEAAEHSKTAKRAKLGLKDSPSCRIVQ